MYSKFIVTILSPGELILNFPEGKVDGRKIFVVLPVF
jgi:hypothetical protein